MLEIGRAQRPCRGETVCGDVVVVVEAASRTVLGVADGLGHGPGAAEAATVFCNHVRANPAPSAHDILMAAHKNRGLIMTRGVAASVVTFDEEARRLDFAGVGNVELRASSREPIKPVCCPGIVGKRLKKLKSFSYELNDGDFFVIFSDGVSRRFEADEYRSLEVQKAADVILEKYGKHHDDATCVVVRFRP